MHLSIVMHFRANVFHLFPKVVYYYLEMFGLIMAVIYIDFKLLIRKSLAFKFIKNSSILNGSF